MGQRSPPPAELRLDVAELRLGRRGDLHASAVHVVEDFDRRFEPLLRLCEVRVDDAKVAEAQAARRRADMVATESALVDLPDAQQVPGVRVRARVGLSVRLLVTWVDTAHGPLRAPPP